MMKRFNSYNCVKNSFTFAIKVKIFYLQEKIANNVQVKSVIKWGQVSMVEWHLQHLETSCCSYSVE